LWVTAAICGAAHTDTMFDYDEYDLKSVISVMSEALLIDDLSNG